MGGLWQGGGRAGCSSLPLTLLHGWIGVNILILMILTNLKTLAPHKATHNRTKTTQDHTEPHKTTHGHTRPHSAFLPAEGLVLFVRPEVSLLLVTSGEALEAHLTGVRLLARVCAHVRDQMV